MSKRLKFSFVGFLATIALFMSLSSAGAYGPSTLYTSPSTDPGPGALYPRVLTLKNSGSYNGRLLATFEQYVSGTPTFPIYESTNGGASWTKISQVSDTVNGWGLRYQPFLYELPQQIGSMPAGTILCFGNSIPSDLSQTKLDVYKSTDHGVTWSFVSSIATGGRADPSGAYDPVWEPFALVYNNKLIVYYSDERDASHNQKLVHVTSTDGLSWSSVVNDIALGTTKRPGMPVIAKLGNGNYIYTYEYGGAPEANFAVYYKISSNPENFGSASDPGTVLRTRDGVVPTSSPYVTWVSGTGDNGTIVVSAYSSSDLYVNSENGASGNWTRISGPIAKGYSTVVEPLADNHSLLVMSGGNLGTSNHNSVVFGSKDLGAASLIKQLESYAAAGSYIRHYDFSIRLDTLPLSTPADGKFRRVTGLASNSGVSFESVNFPGYYLRHYNYELKLQRNDGTTIFAQDATFNQVTGLGSTTGVSFQSYNYPTRYIRQLSGALRIDPISTTAEKNDATFIFH